MSDVPISVLRNKYEAAKAKKWVYWLALKKPQVCGDERLLWLFFWLYVYKMKIKDLTVENLRRTYSPETLSRRLREIREDEARSLQAEGMSVEHSKVRPWNRFAPLPETWEKKCKQRIVIRDYYSDRKDAQTGLGAFLDGSLEGSL